MIPPPTPPEEPAYEDLSTIPDKPHSWGESWENHIHTGYICNDCGAHSACTMCNDDEEQDCLRYLAKDRNYTLKRTYIKAMERYEAQMDYYRSITDNPPPPESGRCRRMVLSIASGISCSNIARVRIS